MSNYAAVNVDEDIYVGADDDGGYVGWDEGPGGWYVSVVIDSETGHFVDSLTEDDGPYPSEREAALAGIGAVIEWCGDNGVELESWDGSFWLPGRLK